MKRPLVQNSADEAQVKGAAKKENFARLVELADLRAQTATVEGRRFLWRVLMASGMDQLSMRRDTHETYYRLGNQSVGLWLEQEIKEADFEGYLKMLVEAREKEEELNA